MRKDDININEAYAKIYQKQNNVLEEGLFDTAKAKFSGAVKGIAPMQRLGSLAAKGLGKVAGTLSPEAGAALQKRSEELGAAASNAGLTAKVKSILQSHTGSIMKISNEIINDLNKLQLNPENMTPEQFGEQMKQQLESMLNAQLPQSTTQDTSTEQPSDTSTGAENVQEPEQTPEPSTPSPAPATASLSTKPAAKKPATKKPAAKKPVPKKAVKSKTK